MSWHPCLLVKVRNGLLGVTTFRIPEPILDETIKFLREVGSEGFEGFVLWGGTIENGAFRFKTSIVPKQRAMLTPNGLLVTVEGEALFEVNRTLHERGEILGAQVHSHPTEAYHSSTDDQFPMVTLLGALSLVIPDFAKNAPNDIDEWAWFRLSKMARWENALETTSIEII
jgi:hypothetical protein